MAVRTKDTDEILATLQPMFQEAEEKGLWFFSPYQQMWFSPRQLRKEQANGRFIWGQPNWLLRDPQEMVSSAQQAAKEAADNMRRVAQMVADEKATHG